MISLADRALVRLVDDAGEAVRLVCDSILAPNGRVRPAP
jgi:hypothetical protein